MMQRDYSHIVISEADETHLADMKLAYLTAARERDALEDECDRLHTQNKRLLGALERRPIPAASSDLFKALGDPVRWMDRYRAWYDSARDVIEEVERRQT